MVKEKVEYVVMEVSSQSLKYHRVDGIIFDYAIFTNISLEHIGENEHTDFEDYFSSKLKIISLHLKLLFVLFSLFSILVFINNKLNYFIYC